MTLVGFTVPDVLADVVFGTFNLRMQQGVELDFRAHIPVSHRNAVR